LWYDLKTLDIIIFNWNKNSKKFIYSISMSEVTDQEFDDWFNDCAAAEDGD